MPSNHSRNNVRNMVQTLPPQHAPSSETTDKPKRLVIVGDVHGQLSKLKQLLLKCKFDQDAGHHLILTGDLVNKGPDSAGVVQLAMDVGASAVRGNNEDRILAACAELRKTEICNNDSPLSSLNPDDPPAAPTYEDPGDYVTAAELTDDQIEWLSDLPVILRIEPLKGATTAPWNAGTIVVVHGGLVPSLALEKQNPWAAMNMRSLFSPSNGNCSEDIMSALKKDKREQELRRVAFGIDGTEDILVARVQHLEIERKGPISTENEGFGSTVVPISGSEGKLWRDAWNEEQNLVADPSRRTVIIYGHDARAGLQAELQVQIPEHHAQIDTGAKWTRYAFGLDSGCTYGRELSALVLEFDDHVGDIRGRIEQV